jgi:hypothetical protein
MTIAVSLATVVLGCTSSLRPISDRAKLGGERADREWVVVASPFSFRHGLDTFTVPAGRYAPAMEDDSGVYFRAPAEILSSGPLTAASVYDGGLYIPLDGTTKPATYIVVRSQLRFFELPADFRYALQR